MGRRDGRGRKLLRPIITPYEDGRAAMMWVESRGGESTLEGRWLVEPLIPGIGPYLWKRGRDWGADAPWMEMYLIVMEKALGFRPIFPFRLPGSPTPVLRDGGHVFKVGG